MSLHQTDRRRRTALRIALLVVVGIAVLWAASQQSICAAGDLLDGEFGNIQLDRQIIEPAQLPSLSELREAVKQPKISAVLLFKLFGDANNHHLPVWSGDGKRLAFQRGDVRAKTSKLLLFANLADPKPSPLSGDPSSYEYMFRWGVNSPAGFAFSRMATGEGAPQICVSSDGQAIVEKTTGAGRHLSPTLYERTDGIWRLAYVHDGQLMLEAWNEQGRVEPPLPLGRATSPRWSNDGFRLVLAREKAARAGDYEIMVRNLKTDAEIVFATDVRQIVRSPNWSPDQLSVAFYTRDVGDNKPWKVHVAAIAEPSAGHSLGGQVVVNPDFELEGPSWEPTSRRIWMFSDAHRREAYYPLVAASVDGSGTITVDYSTRCTTPNDLAVNPDSYVPEMAFVAHERLPQDLFILLLNHY